MHSHDFETGGNNGAMVRAAKAAKNGMETIASVPSPIYLKYAC